MHTHEHTCMHMHEHMCEHMCAHVCAHKYTCTHIFTCARVMHANMHAHICDVCVHGTCVRAHVFTQRLQDDFCIARFQLEALRVTGALRAWSGILVKENQAVSCFPHVLGQGGGLGPHYLVQHTQNPPYTWWGGTTHLRLPVTLCTRAAKDHSGSSSPPCLSFCPHTSQS